MTMKTFYWVLSSLIFNDIDNNAARLKALNISEFSLTQTNISNFPVKVDLFLRTNILSDDK